ncbi:MAG: dihydrofolate reductase family protein [Pseudoxanthomonas sp.]
MGRLIVEQIVSVDGYAADADGGIGFFSSARQLNDSDPEQMKMLERVGAIVLGAVTYRMFADYWPTAEAQAEPVAMPINTLPKFVVSSSLASAPWGERDAGEILRGDGVESVRALRKRIAGDLIVWGSLTLADALLRAGEVDVLRLRLVPVLLGRGRSFAPADLGERKLSLAGSHAYEGGLVVLEYGSVDAGQGI